MKSLKKKMKWEEAHQNLVPGIKLPKNWKMKLLGITQPIAKM
jgi:hypothetical protein